MAVFSYAVKFLCGEFDRQLVGEHTRLEGPVKPGNYLTAINIHNPNGRVVPMEKRAVLLFAGGEPTRQERFEVPVKPAPSFKAELPPDWGMEIDAPDIRMQLLRGAAPPAPTFIKGWVIISSPAPLDVVAVLHLAWVWPRRAYRRIRTRGRPRSTKSGHAARPAPTDREGDEETGETQVALGQP